MQEIFINTPVINLDQLLKWAGIVDTGGQVKLLIAENLIRVNGIIISERRKKIRPGDIIEIQDIGIWKAVHQVEE
ncbi:MAG: ribosome-associated protein [Firmicutes bacterium]|nr:ribosome-associated protein [Bacillota bacterium]